MVWRIVFAVLAIIVVSGGYRYYRSSNRYVSRSEATAVTLKHSDQSITITNAEVLGAFVKALRSGYRIHRSCDCAIGGEFEVQFANAQTLSVPYTSGHDEGRFDVIIARHLYSVPKEELLNGLKKLGVRLPGFAWDYSQDGIPTWPPQ